jgi:hypothetical protein
MTELKILTNDNKEEVKPNRIYELKNYADEEGRMVLSRHPINNPDDVSYVGSFMVNSPMGPMRLSIDYPLDYSLTKCFEEFDDKAKEVLAELEEEARNQELIATPNNKNIIIPK